MSEERENINPETTDEIDDFFYEDEPDSNREEPERNFDKSDTENNISADTEEEENTIKKKNKRKKHSVFLKVTAAIIIALAALFVGLMIFCIANLPKDTVSDNVMVENLDVGGLTYDETLAAVKATYLFENQNLTIKSGDKTRVLDGKQLNLCASPEATAEKAFNYGKSGNILKDGLTAMRLLVKQKVIVPVAYMDHDVLNSELGKFGKEVCGVLSQVSVDFTDTEAIVTPGTTGFDYNTDTAREEILKAVDNEQFDNISVTLNAVDPDKVDTDYVDTAIYRDVSDAYYDINGSDVMVIAEIYGRFCNRNDIDEVLDKINTPGGEPVRIAYQTIEPKVFAADLSEKLFNATLGSYSTSYVAGGNRGKNVARAASLINGTILASGETFSFNDTVGDRSTENGFFSAPEYVAGQSVTGIGGGTCQVSSTLYSAVLYADMGIVSRTEHMMKVGYMPAGQDATVAYGSIDFKFKNTSDYPIKISAVTGGGKITVSVIGTEWDPPRVVKIKHSVSTVGENTVVYSKRLVYSNGQLISEDTLDSSSYAPHKSEQSSSDDDDDDD